MVQPHNIVQPVLEEKRLKAALFQFVFPFSLNEDCQDDLKHQLKRDGFSAFDLGDLELENAFYGKGYQVSHLNLERYYLPFTNSVIFPHEDSKDVFLRYSKRLELACSLQIQQQLVLFGIHSVDVVLCPFDLGFITVRSEVRCEDLTYSQVLEFVNRFRILQNMKDQDEPVQLVHNGKRYNEVEEFILDGLVPGMMPFLDKTDLEKTYFEKLPFFVDERMFVQGLVSFTDNCPIAPEDIYRASRVDGLDLQGQPYISSSNMDYIQRYLDEHIYDRWGPDTYYVIEENSFFCLTNQSSEVTTALGNHMYGAYYYGVLINLFYKIVLLKLSNRYSHVQLDQNQEEIDDLIRSITIFSARYYFLEVATQSQGKEIFLQLRKHLGSDELYAEVNETLADLYKYQENFTAKRSNYLLLILTIYSVVSGIYGMNQVIDDLKGQIDWGKMKDYSVFEYIALAVMVTGMGTAVTLGTTTLWRLMKEMGKRK
ncbi:hypothetical protein SAMN03159341_108243 [Paenibacillus sp. 1_12]|uniref:hypothetical protein n=1 Tax=Paenibacillus sp. 1_12 TaxID=1566278 RepID=UPI0008E40B62|nr:hypothetical protein [Paenibacillus sp. 1_12]SFL69219.1 hypothetical protein SAMN03159341_108243 [Paenibacillus sp. 1_12]